MVIAGYDICIVKQHFCMASRSAIILHHAILSIVCDIMPYLFDGIAYFFILFDVMPYFLTSQCTFGRYDVFLDVMAYFLTL